MSGGLLFQRRHQVSGLPQHIQPRALGVELRIIERNPFFVLIETRFFHLPQRRPALIHLRQNNGKPGTGEIEIRLGQFPGDIRLVNFLIALVDIEHDLVARHFDLGVDVLLFVLGLLDLDRKSVV